ncbi:MAG: acyltransferase [Planctomycetota bacterium]
MDRPTPPPPDTPSPRYPVLDALRIVAMLDIVSIHITKPGQYLFWGMGLPVFIIVAVALSVRKPELPTWADLPGAARKRATRILVPWLIWTVFFGLNRLLWAGLDPEKSVGGLFYPWMIPSGTSIHLWFLPFIFVAELAVIGAMHPLRRVPTGVVIAGALALGVGAVLLTGHVYDLKSATYGPLAMDSEDYAERAALYGWMVRKSWLFGTASVCFGVALGRTLSLTGSATPRRLFLGVALGMFGLYFLWAGGHGRVDGHAIWQWWRQCFALLLVAIAVQYVGGTPPWLMRIAVLTMGIYILHGWVNSRLGTLLGLLYDLPVWQIIWPIGSVMHHRFGKLAVVWLLTATLVALLRRTRAKHVL